MMELVKLVTIVVLLLTNVFCQDIDAGTWREGFAGTKEANLDGLQDFLARMTRKLGSRPYLGLMRKKELARTKIARKRHKFETFVGLMGKRGFNEQEAA